MAQMTAVRGEGGGETGQKKKGLAKEYICMTHEHRQQCDDALREGGDGARRSREKWGGSGVICKSVNNKNKEKKLKRTLKLFYLVQLNLKHLIFRI